MLKTVAILEDDSRRVGEMRACLGETSPRIESIFFESADEIIAWLGEHLAEVALISLDHDLPLRQRDGHLFDCGTGREVADFLACLVPTCPIIVHSSNEHFAPGMVFALREAGWQVGRVYPNDDLAWVRRDWVQNVLGYLRHRDS